MNLDGIVRYLGTPVIAKVLRQGDKEEAQKAARMILEPQRPRLNVSLDRVSRGLAVASYLAAKYTHAAARVKDRLEDEEGIDFREIRKTIGKSVTESRVRSESRAGPSAEKLQRLRLRFRRAQEVAGLLVALRDGARKRLRALEQISNNDRQDARQEDA